ncbi:hypothetical protein TI05_02925 [Achromatium sp. WMS3]|nr:hypothetical protein TI05_02925 [Achromatium sp. WMS3]
MLASNNVTDLKTPPSKLYFTIGEVSNICDVKPHVLRYWEQEFPQLKPTKRRGNRRYYQPQDVAMVRKIRGLLYDQGFTICGARQHLTDDNGARHELLKEREMIRQMRLELEEILVILQ